MTNGSADNIQVAIRIRPLLQREKEKDLRIQWNIQNNNIYQIDEIGQRNGELYTFDHIFDMSKTNEAIYDEIVKDFVDSALNGLNATIFAYGQTCSGKTYTMLGHDRDKGIVPLAIDYIFESVSRTPERKFLIRVSYVEIYNEKINDLLDPTHKDIKIREFLSGVIGLQQVKEDIVSTPDQVQDLLKVGALNRRIGATNMNERSSRSHTIFKIVIESVERCDFNDKECPVQISSLNLVDLAGSERVAQTKATGVRLKEGGHINKSLSALSLVIRQLSDGQEYVNFRDSKLTRLLQHSLGGNAKTLIIATITLTSVDITNSTLSFAQRAKAVKNKPQVNEIVPDSVTCKRYSEINAQLKQRLHDQLIIIQNLEKSKEQSSKEIGLLQDQMHMLEIFLHGKRHDSPIAVPKRRHTIGHTGRKTPLKVILEESEEANHSPERWTPAQNRHFRAESTTPWDVEKSDTFDVDVSELKLRIQELEQDYRALEKDHVELINFTQDERNILDETSRKNEELENQLKRELKIISEMKSSQKIEEEIIVAQINNKLKIREEELINKIADLEKQLKDKNDGNNNLPDLSSEIKYVQAQLKFLQDVLENSEFERFDLNLPKDPDNNSMQPLIESFNAKIKTAKEMIEHEIWKQINCFSEVNEKLNNEPLALPNELESFNCLLNELYNVENELPSELIDDGTKANIENIKDLHKIHESLLKKNDLIGRFSEKVGSLKEHINVLKDTVSNLQAESINKEQHISAIEQIFRSLQEEVMKVNQNMFEDKIPSEELSNYKHYVSKFVEEIIEAKKVRTELECNLHKLHIEHKVCNEQLTEYKQIVTKLSDEIRGKDEELKRLNSLMVEKNGIISELKPKLESMQQMQDNCSSEIVKTSKQYNEEIDFLKIKINDLESQLYTNEQFKEYFKVKEKLETEVKPVQHLENTQAQVKHLTASLEEEKESPGCANELAASCSEFDAQNVQNMVKRMAEEMVRKKWAALIAERDDFENKWKKAIEENCQLNEYFTVDPTTVAFNDYKNGPEDNDTAEYNALFQRCRKKSDNYRTSCDVQTKALKEESNRLNSMILANKETVDNLTLRIEEYKTQSANNIKTIQSLQEINNNLKKRIKSMEDEVSVVKFCKDKSEQLTCDINRYKIELCEKTEDLRTMKVLYEQIKFEIEKVKINHKNEVDKYSEKLQLNEKRQNQLQEEIDIFREQTIGLNRRCAKLEQTLCNVIEQIMKQERILLITKLPQEQRDSLKHIRKDLKDVNLGLRDQLQRFQTKCDYDLDKINGLLLKSVDILNKYFSSEKSFLQTQIEKLELTNSEYLHEIQVFKELNNRGCTDCQLLKNEKTEIKSRLNSKEIQLTETLTKLRLLQEKLLATARSEQTNRPDGCPSCLELQVSLAETKKKLQKSMSDLVDLTKKYYKQNKEDSEIRHTGPLNTYTESIAYYKTAAKARKDNLISVEVQCNIHHSELMKKYDLTKQLCVMRKAEINELKTELLKLQRKVDLQQVR